jgi:flagellar biosynthesis protein
MKSSESGQQGLQKRRKAVALRYDDLKEPAPRVIAKGQGLIAEKIIALAREQNIPIHEDRDLVEALAKVETEQVIPPQLYQAVAEILAFLYRLNALQKGKRTSPAGPRSHE